MSVKLPLFASDTLHQKPGVLINQDTHFIPLVFEAFSYQLIWWAVPTLHFAACCFLLAASWA
jgi:hypothetical protein